MFSVVEAITWLPAAATPPAEPPILVEPEIRAVISELNAVLSRFKRIS